MLSNRYVNAPLSNLGVYHYGFDELNPGQSYGPAIWDCYLIHYIRTGKGQCTIDGQTFNLHKGQGFLIQPGQIGYYIADEEDPWTYCYIGFDGNKAKSYLEEAKITSTHPTFTYRLTSSLSEIIRQLVLVENNIAIRETTQTSLIYRFISQLIENSVDTNTPSRYSGERSSYYTNLATTYIAQNYATRISIKDVARHVGLNQSYLGSIFKKEYNISPQEFLLTFRLERACDLMNNPLLSIGDISRSVGYNDPLQFSKIFKKLKGQSPKTYRNTHYMKGD